MNVNAANKRSNLFLSSFMPSLTRFVLRALCMTKKTKINKIAHISSNVDEVIENVTFNFYVSSLFFMVLQSSPGYFLTIDTK